MAVYKFFGSKVEPVPCKDFRDVFESVKTGAVPNGVVPIENSIEGSVNQNYDLFFSYDLKVCGEVAVKLAHVLIANPQTKFEDIETVYSHPQALGQCRSYLEKQKWEIIPAYDTAGSVKMIKEKQFLNAAAIASEKAADLYNMKIVARDIADNPSNYTRFLLLAHEDAAPTGDEQNQHHLLSKTRPRNTLPRPRRIRIKKHQPNTHRIKTNQNNRLAIQLLPRLRRTQNRKTLHRSPTSTRKICNVCKDSRVLPKSHLI
jgi:chorismate mutase/prephenate dehydratase